MTCPLRLLSVVFAVILAGCRDGEGSLPESTEVGRFGSTSSSAPNLGADDHVPDTREVWRWAAPPPGSVGMPAADATGIAAAYGRVGVVVVDHAGALVWDVRHPRVRDVAPTLTPELVLVATEEGLVALDRATGAVEWEVSVSQRVNTPVIVGRRAVATTWEGSLLAFDLVDGAESWRTSLPGPAIAPAATDGEVVVATWESISGTEGGVVAVGAAGAPLWSRSLEADGVGGPAVVGNAGQAVVVLVAGDVAAHGLSLADGTELWRSGTEGGGSPEVPPVALAGGGVLVPDRLGGLTVLDSATGDRQWGGAATGIAVRGGPVAIGPGGPFAFPLDDGRLLLLGPGLGASALDWPGRISGVAVTPGGLLVVATREARQNFLLAIAGLGGEPR